MNNETYAKGMAEIDANCTKIVSLKKEKQTKFNIYSYRDAIYDLTKKGYEIKNKDITTGSGGTHRIWWLAGFEEEFVLEREEKVF